MDYNTPALRKLLTNAFNAEEFEHFCYDYFPDVYGSFAGMMIMCLPGRWAGEGCRKQIGAKGLLQYLSNKHCCPQGIWRLYSQKQWSVWCCFTTK
jgi:hypothetical protein